MKSKTTFLTGTVLDEENECTLSELCRICNVSIELIHEMIDEGMITPVGESPMEWRFSSIEIWRIKTSLRLQRDLRINLPGCALALDLLEELDRLRKSHRKFSF